MLNKAKTKSKLQLSENLKLGVASPSSQSAFYKYSGVIFMVLSLILIRNIYVTIKSNGGIFHSSKVLTSAELKQQVLGAYDEAAAHTTFTTYKVQRGDTVFSIAQAKGLNWNLIAQANNLKPPYTLHIGQTLQLPAAPQNQN